MSRFVDQDKFGPVEGNCFNAALASLLSVPLADVPDFRKAGPTEAHWWQAVRDWLASRGWGLVSVRADAHFGDQKPPGLLLTAGMSPRGLLHSVITKDGKIIHDPHPSRAGIEKATDVDLIYPLDPAAFVLATDVPPKDA